MERPTKEHSNMEKSIVHPNSWDFSASYNVSQLIENTVFMLVMAHHHFLKVRVFLYLLPIFSTYPWVGVEVAWVVPEVVVVWLVLVALHS